MNSRRASQVLFAFAFVIALVRAIQLRWVMDDAFISFRYAQNLARGRGLVFNVGERVEGYTNFLWTVVISGGMRLGMDPILLASTLGILGYLGTIVVLGAVSRRLGQDLPQYLDQYLRRIDAIPTEQVISNYAFLRRFYFDVNDDRAREEKFLARIRASNS